MVPPASTPDDTDEDRTTPADQSAADAEPTKLSSHNPAVLRAALEIVKRKKAEAVRNEEYEVAHRFHQKAQELERQLQLAGDIAEPEEGESADAMNSASFDAARKRAKAAKSATPARRTSMFSAPNPLRTLGLLEQSGYSRMQACGLLSMLYIAVFLVEIGFLYVGWTYWNKSGGEGIEDYSDEF
mmetsp:Transcript_42820/g.100392  ORF Transcript_42820/g.100392 Transcript_42820/m.100392 type:complete len:185 (+) Transcript_42820:82-636(+)